MPAFAGMTGEQLQIEMDSMESLFVFFSPLLISIVGFFICSIIIAIAGTFLTKISDQLADITGLGEALFGAVFVGLSTSLSGTVASITSAFHGYPQLAASNAVGGIILQMSFLAIADIVYRKANLEHAAASLANIMQGLLLITSLSIVLIAIFTPSHTLFAISPISVSLIAMAIIGFRLIANSQKKPMWRPIKTVDTIPDIKHYGAVSKKMQNKLWLLFISLSVLVSISGYIVAKAAIVIVDTTHLSQSIVGGFFTAGTSSLPELIIAIVAVRQGALTLAVGNIIGGSVFDVLCLAFSDFAYRPGSIYKAINTTEIFMVCLSILLIAILTLGLLYRQRKGPGKIGWESLLMLLISIGGYIVVLHGA
jgi:cation:H+ antiporter